MLASGARDSGSSPLGGAAIPRVVLAVFALALAASACSGAAPPPPVTPTIRTALVRIPAYRFDPDRLEIGRGTVVTWQNDDTDHHVIVNSPTPAIAFNRDGTYDLRLARFVLALDPGGSASFTFNDAGTYYYYCLVHNTMRGIVVVR